MTVTERAQHASVAVGEHRAYGMGQSPADEAAVPAASGSSTPVFQAQAVMVRSARARPPLSN